MALLVGGGDRGGRPMLPEPGHYGYAPWRGRPRIAWPGGARIAVWVVPNVEHYELDPPRHPYRANWARPVPDVLAYSWRDYGNRAGFWRMAEAMRRFGIPGSVSLNVAVADHLPEIVEHCCAAGWELFSHGFYNTRYLYDMSEQQLRDLIGDCRETIRRVSGQRMDGWLSPALSNDDQVQHLLAEEGLLYTCDMVHDDQPMPVDVRAGTLMSLPYSLEVNDVAHFILRNGTAEDYARVLIAQFEQLRAEGEESGTVLCIPLHPYLIGQPHRIGALETVLEHIARADHTWIATGREIAAWWRDHHRAEVEAWLAAGVPA